LFRLSELTIFFCKKKDPRFTAIRHNNIILWPSYTGISLIVLERLIVYNACVACTVTADIFVLCVVGGVLAATGKIDSTAASSGVVVLPIYIAACTKIYRRNAKYNNN